MQTKKFKITGGEWALVIVMTLLAVFFTNEYFLRFLASLNSALGFLIYYIVVYSALTVMSYFGLIVFGIKIKKPLQILGTGLILFAFFLIFDWSSNYLNIVNASKALINNSEDAIVWDFWAWLLQPTLSAFRRWVTWFIVFPLSVFIITLLGVLLNRRKPELSA